MFPLPNLRRLRLAQFLTQEELAQRAGLTRLSVNRIEGGQPARLSTIRRLAAALGVEPSALTAPEPHDQGPGQGQHEAAA